MRSLQLLSALIIAGDIDAAVTLVTQLGHSLTYHQLMVCAKSLIHWMVIITPGGGMTGRTIHQSEQSLSRIAALLGDKADNLRLAACNQFIAEVEICSDNHRSAALLWAAINWCRKIETKHLRKQVGRRIHELTILGGYDYQARDASSLTNSKYRSEDRLHCLVMARYNCAVSHIWGGRI